MKIESIQQLRVIYNLPSERAVSKDIGEIDKHAAHFINCSPFCIISTFDLNGNMDVSPRGGNQGFVHVVDENCILLPDARGNNRLDCLTNIIETSRIGMLFLIPGIEETLRINGSAFISTDPLKLSSFNNDKFKYISVIEIKVEEVFLHCAKALMRSNLWDVSHQMNSEEFPSMGEMLKDQLKLNTPAEKRSETKKRYLSDL